MSELPIAPGDLPGGEDRRIVERVAAHGQGHVLRYWSELDHAGRRALVDQLAAIDLGALDRLVRELVAGAPGKGTEARGEPRPPRMIPLPEDPAGRRDRGRARALGQACIAAGRVAVMMVAGGQGTRLGYPHPKGLYPIGPVTGRTLYQLHAEKILAASRRHATTIPWIVMTSDATHDETRAAFEEASFFGLPQESIQLVRQAMMPVVDPAGKLLLADRGRVAMSPNGHGGALLALREGGGLDRMRDEGRDVLFFFQVDNPLVPVPDPVFIGYHVRERAEMSTKVVAKTDPAEKVGVVVEMEGKTRVIEYSDLDPEETRARERDGRLRLRAGNIAVHVLDRTFAERETEHGFRLPFHVARKSADYVDERGRTVKPEGKNAVKFETFIFDALPHARRTVTQEVDRAREFAPVKNETGNDSPETARRALCDLYGTWFRRAGIRVPLDEAGHVRGRLEISPLFADDAGAFAMRLRGRDLAFRDGLVLTEKDA